MWGGIKPRCCLRIGAHEVTWVDSARSWGRRQNSYASRSLPAGLVKPSPVAANISDPGVLRAYLEALIGRQGDGPARFGNPVPSVRRAALVLSDLCMRFAVLKLDKLPRSHQEQEALVRWRLGKEHLFPLSGTRVVFQNVRGGGSPAQGPHSVLAVAIRESVLREYETMCEQVGITPIEVDATSFRLFNMWARATRWAGRGKQEDVLWVSVFDGGLTVLVVHGAQPVFIRNKSISAGEQVRGSGYEPVTDKLVEEVLSSVEACVDSCPSLAVRHLVVASDVPQPAFAKLLQEEVGVQVEELGWDRAREAGWSAEHPDATPAGLPAVAGLLGGA